MPGSTTRFEEETRTPVKLIKEGWALKRNTHHNSLTKWSKRWFILTDQHLYYLKEKEGPEVTAEVTHENGELNLNEFKAKVDNKEVCKLMLSTIREQPKMEDYCFEVITYQYDSYILKLSNEIEYLSWVDTIKLWLVRSILGHDASIPLPYPSPVKILRDDTNTPGTPEMMKDEVVVTEASNDCVEIYKENKEKTSSTRSRTLDSPVPNSPGLSGITMPCTPESHHERDENPRSNDVNIERLGAVFVRNEPKEIATIHQDEISRGKRLGQGCFSYVYLMNSFTSASKHDSTYSEAVRDARRDLREEVEVTQEITRGDEDSKPDSASNDEKDDYDSSQKLKFAIKTIKDDFANPKQYLRAAKDLDREINILSKLDHPNIIKLHAKSSDANDAMKCTKENAHLYFIILDRLSGTLTQKIALWKYLDEKITNLDDRDNLLMQRLRVGYNVACALSYLHSQNVIYRDLKSDNVGFDFAGNCKLFDFGLSRELPTSDDDELENEQLDPNETFKMTAKTGSLLLMAPEVFHGKPYNQKADVYSYGVLLWNILELDLPYVDFITGQTFETKVMEKGKRPDIQKKLPDKVQFLLRLSWAHNVEMRPTMNELRRFIRVAIKVEADMPKSRRVSGY